MEWREAAQCATWALGAGSRKQPPDLDPDRGLDPDLAQPGLRGLEENRRCILLKKRREPHLITGTCLLKNYVGGWKGFEELLKIVIK